MIGEKSARKKPIYVKIGICFFVEIINNLILKIFLNIISDNMLNNNYLDKMIDIICFRHLMPQNLCWLASGL